MAARPNRGFPKVSDISEPDFGAGRRRRAAMAFLAGSLLFVTSAAAMISVGASAHGPRMIWSALGGREIAPSSYPGFRTVLLSGMTDVPLDKPAKRKRTRLASSPRKSGPYSVAANFSGRRPVCVRLCDGFFFPESDAAGAGDAVNEQASCESLCPDAPVALYYQPSGSDNIEEAYSVGGQPYAALPVALRYRSTEDNTCSCHRSLATALAPLVDGTLRKGDVVMTSKGFLVFRGVEQANHTAKDFAALATAALPADQRATLRSLERVSMAPQRGVTRSWAAAPAAPAAVKTATSEANDKIRFVERSD